MKVLLIVAGLVAVIALAAAFVLYTPDLDRAALERKYHVAPEDYVGVAGIQLHVVETGPRDAPAIVMLHGFGSSLQTFDAWAGVLSAKYRVVRYDLPGFGLTGPDPTGEYSDTRARDVLRALLDRLGIARASLIGNSMGGRLAWQFAASDPARVDKLILVSPDGFASPGFEYGHAPDVPPMLRLLPYTLPRAMLRMTIAPAFGDPKRLTDGELTRYRDMMLAPGVRRAIIARTAQTVLEDPEPMLRRIKAPTLLLWGEKDGMIPVANAADYKRNIPNATLVVLPGIGHVPQEEAPAETVTAIEHFLAG